MTNGIRIIVTTSTEAEVIIEFVHEHHGTVVRVGRNSPLEAIEAAIFEFKSMQSAAIEEMAKIGMIRKPETEPAGELS